MKPPSWRKTQWAGHILTPKKVMVMSLHLCQGWALQLTRFRVGNERSQMRFSETYLLNLLKCLWSISQWLTTRVCIPWYLSSSVTEKQFSPPDGQCDGWQYWRSWNLHFAWTWNSLNSVFLHYDLQLKDNNLPLYCATAHIYEEITISVPPNCTSKILNRV